MTTHSDKRRDKARNLAFSSMGGYFLYDTAPESWSKPCIDVKALCKWIRTFKPRIRKIKEAA